MFQEAFAKARRMAPLSVHDLLALLWAQGQQAEMLFALADEMRAAFFGNEVHLRGIIEFSNYCVQNCLYCGLRRGNTGLSRYRLEKEELMEISRQAAALGFKTLVLQSGEDSRYTGAVLAEIISGIKRELDVAVTLSVGERSRADYAAFKEAGADRYLLKHETADPVLFRQLRPGATLSGRLRKLRWLKELGYQTGSGNMVGLPGQTLESIALDLILMRQVEADMAGIGPFIPHDCTPLKNRRGGDFVFTLKVLAVARMAMPGAHLPATTAMDAVCPDGRKKALQCGANVVMLNVTPLSYRRRYCIYPARAGMDKEPAEQLDTFRSILTEQGKKAGTGYGHALRLGAHAPNSASW
ncbi:MAG: [FeFe] hydrogenase H-cluster radical SAM maturase HydE [Peptococcaceae bacterium]|nr:MAG: [FeFe] hydrogenase H-cluster radical SAM maturase HydE [Peptococcaceae bacterium]